MIQLTPNPIDLAPLLAEAQQPAAGAVVAFVGVTREFTAGQQTTTLHYQAYPEMAQREMAKLAAAAREKWPLVSCALVHRTGEVPLGEASVAVVVAAPHRGPAFDAARWLIDELKRSVPIWKQEHYADGKTEWVHPTESPPPAGEG